MARVPEPRPIAVSTALFDGYSMEAAIHEIAASGASHVEPAFIRGYVEFDENAFSAASASIMARALAEAGLKSVAVSAHLDLALPEAADMLRRRLDFAERIGAGYVITNTGAQRNADAIFRTIEAVLPACEQADVALALENPGHGEGDLIGNGADGAAVVARFASPFVRLNYDAGNIFTYSREARRPEHDIAEALPAIAHLHLKDVAGDENGWRFTPLGEGSIDYAALWKLVPADLPVGIELPLRLERPNRADPARRPEPLPLPELRDSLLRSLAFVRQVD
jgi:sugar phosphate isomerase/epimerase